MTHELKPCPFCASAAPAVRVFKFSDTTHKVVCDGCKTGGPWLTSHHLAVKSWNTRAETTAQEGK